MSPPVRTSPSVTDFEASPAGAPPAANQSLRRLKKLQHIRDKAPANNENEEQEEQKESGESAQSSPTAPPPRVIKRARQQQQQQPHGARSKRRMDARMFLDDEAEYVIPSFFLLPLALYATR